MASLNTSSNGPSITQSYQKVVQSPPPSGAAASSKTYGQWALFSVQAPLVSAFQAESGKESVLKVQTTGEGELIDLVEEFSDGRIQFAFVKVKDSNSGLPKNVLICWCGEGVPERTKGYFTSHMTAVAKLLHGYHVQVTARSSEHLTPETIVQKVADSSGSKYSGGGADESSSGGPPLPAASKPKPAMPTKTFGASSGGGMYSLGGRSARAQKQSTDNDGWGEDAPEVTRSQLEKVSSAYQPTKVNMAELQSQKQTSSYQAPERSNGASDVVKGGYQPIGKVDINAIRQQAKESGTMKDDRPTTVKGSYEPVGKVDINAIKAKAQGAPASAAASSPPAQEQEERPQSLAERSAAFTSSERMTAMPKPKVASRFGSQNSSFAGTKAPAPGGFEAKPNTGAAPVGAASRTFADEGGKTPAQIWQEKKARERGNSNAAEPQVASTTGGGPASPIASQQSGQWQSGYEGKKWGVQIPSRTGGSGVSAQKTGQSEPPVQEDEEEQSGPPQGGVGSIRDRFAGSAPMGAPSQASAPSPPPLDTASKPNAGAARGVPMPGLPQRPAEDDEEDQEVPAQQHQTLPPPPAPAHPRDESPDQEDEPYPTGSPIRVAQPVAREPSPAPLPAPAASSPPPMPTSSLNDAIAHNKEEDLEPEPQIETQDPARGAAQAAAASSFGATAAEDSRGTGSEAGKTAIAQYDYEKAEDNELELRDGERITGIEMVDEDWWMGQNSRGETGLFPSNYVELVEGEEDRGGAGSAPHVPEAGPVPVAAPGAGGDVDSGAGGAGKKATAQYDYEAAEDNELSFPDGATITGVEFPDDDWWYGSYGGKSGLFPANYVELQ